ncbi:unnamed protein product [Allacma fusca]|uniref:Uncharacterized protein n=1 Tax=Allacma fusca TaxID=39272 RepID=A0A8J2J393_9HEXA|nr:unnamed protein product [Allacma fusca]
MGNLNSDREQFNGCGDFGIRFSTNIISRIILEIFPYNLSDYDEDGAPIWVFELGKWDVRSFLEKDNETAFAMDVACDQICHANGIITLPHELCGEVSSHINFSKGNSVKSCVVDSSRMFTRKSSQTLNTLLKLTRFSVTIPYKWDPQSEQFVPLKSWYWKCISIFNIGLIFISSVQTLSSFISGAIDGTDLVRITIDFLFAFGYTAVLCNYIACFLKTDEFVDFVRKFMDFNRTCTYHVYRTQYPLKRDNCLEILVAITLCHFYFPIFAALIFLQNPNNELFLYRLIPLEIQSIYTLILWCPVQAYTAWLFCSAFYLYFIFIFLYTASMNFWLQGVLQNQNNSFSQPERAKIYNSVLILNKISNKCFSNTTWPTLLIIFVSLSSYSIFGTLKMFGKVPLHVYVTFPFTCCSIFIPYSLVIHFVGLIYERSSQYVKERFLMAANKSKYEKLKARALREAGANVASIFDIKIVTNLLVIVTVSNLTINALLLH